MSYQLSAIRNRRWLGAGVLVLACALELGSESVNLTTYYPAPSGVYAQMITTSDTWLARDGGKVGIGTTDPQFALDVSGNMKANGYVLNPGALLHITTSAYTTGGAAIGFFSAGEEKVTITHGGTVSIGNSNPHEGNFRLEIGRQSVPANEAGPVGAMRVRQTECAVKKFTNALGFCDNAVIVSGSCESNTNCYVTSVAGILTEYSIPAGSVTDIDLDGTAGEGYMLCCPCGGLCPNPMP